MADSLHTDVPVRDANLHRDSSADAAILKDLIHEFTSNLSRNNIHLKGSLLFTLGKSSEATVQFQPCQKSKEDAPSHLHDVDQLHPLHQTNLSSLGDCSSSINKNTFEEYERSLGLHHVHAPQDLVCLAPSSRPLQSDLIPHSFVTADLPDDVITEPYSQEVQIQKPKMLLQSSSSSNSLPSFEKIIQQRYPSVSSQYVANSTYTVTFESLSHQDNNPTLAVSGINENISANSVKRPGCTVSENTTSRMCSDSKILRNEFWVTVHDNAQIPTVTRSTVAMDSTKTENVNMIIAAEHDATKACGLTLNDHDGTMRTELLYENGSSLKKPKGLLPLVLQKLQERNLTIGELECCSHKELVAMLAEILDVQDRCDTSETLATCEILNSVQDTNSECNKFQMGESAGKPASHEVFPKSKVYERKEQGKMNGTLRKSQRKRVRPARMQNSSSHQSNGKNESTCEKKSSSIISGDNISAVSLRSRRRNSKHLTAAQMRNSGDKALELSESAIQPLKKRNRLWSSVDYDLSSDLCDDNSSNTQDNANVGTISEQNKPLKYYNNKTTSQISKFSCKHCFKVFSSRIVYRRHIKIHRPTSGFQCDVCGKTLKTKDSLYHHQRGLHTKEKPYTCRQCSETFNFHHSYKLHMLRHKGERPFKCDTCHKTYLTSNHLKVHREATHGVGDKVCHVCGKTFSYTCTLKLHLKKHAGDRPFQCDKCDKCFITKYALKAHSICHEEGKNHSCQICGKFYKSEHSRNIHMKRHSTHVRTFMCELCGQAFHFKSTLNAHMDIHSKARPHSCPQCGKSFKTKASLYTHKNVHKDTQPYVCTICGKAFKAKNCCTAHMKRHGNESYPCSQCGSTFPDKGGLSKHMKTVHLPKKQFTCTLCGKKGTRSDNMRTHVKSHRNETAAVANPMNFIIEEAISEDDVNSRLVHVRSRSKGSRHRGSKRLCAKDSLVQHNQSIGSASLKDVKSVLLNTLALKTEVTSSSALQAALLNTPVFDHQHYNSEIPFHNEEKIHHGNYLASATSVAHDHQIQHHLHHSIHTSHKNHQYNQEQNKYLAYLHSQPEQSESGSPSLPFGPMTGLLSAVTPSSEHDTVLGNSLSSSAAYHSSLAPIHPSQSLTPGSQRMESSLYPEPLPIQGSLTQLQQILSRANKNHSSGRVNHHRSSIAAQDHGHLQYQ